MTQGGTNNNKACSQHQNSTCCFTLLSWSDSLDLSASPFGGSKGHSFFFFLVDSTFCLQRAPQKEYKYEEERLWKDGSLISLPRPVCLQLSGVMSYTIKEMEGREQISHGLSIFWWAVSTDWFQRVGQKMTGWSVQIQLEVKLQVYSQPDLSGNMRSEKMMCSFC